MALARVFPGTGLGETLIRKLGDAGGPVSSRVSQELDNLIAWVQFAPRRIHFNTSIVGNVGAGLDVLHTFSLDTPNRLLTDGDELIVWYGGNTTANDTDKRVNAFFGGTAYEGAAVTDIDLGIGWTIAARIIRLSSSSVRVSHTYMHNALIGDSTASPSNVNTSGGGTFLVSRSNDITGLTLNGAITMEVKGEGAADNDVKQNFSSIWLIQQ